MTYSFKVLAVTQNRLGARLVPGMSKMLGPKSERAPPKWIQVSDSSTAAKGSGRPTSVRAQALNLQGGLFRLRRRLDFDFDFDDGRRVLPTPTNQQNLSAIPSRH